MEDLKVLKKRLENIEDVLAQQGDDHEKTANYIYNVAVLPLIQENDILREQWQNSINYYEDKEEEYIKMFASWLMDEGYLIDGEKTDNLDIDRLYSYWNVN